MKKLLIIAMAPSVHVGRWIQQINDQGWEIHLFDPSDTEPNLYHPKIQNVTIYHSVYQKRLENVRQRGVYIPLIPGFWLLAHMIRYYYQVRRPAYWKKLLARLIDKEQFDAIHIMEFQHGGYLFLDAKRYVTKPLPPVIVTNWGNDIFLFNHMDKHKPQIRALLEAADYYDCECERDIKLAHELGFEGKMWPVFPNTGGHMIDKVAPLRQAGPASDRRMIMIKGYQSWQGRSLFVLKALERVQDLLQGYKVVVFSAFQEEVQIAIQLFKERTSIDIDAIPHMSHDEMMSHFGRARLYVCSNITDGLNTAMGEAITMGAFPVITGTSCADEWLIDGETGIIIRDPEDIDEIERALRHALTDDAMIDNAAERNYQVAEQRLDSNKIQALVIDLYEQVFAGK